MLRLNGLVNRREGSLLFLSKEVDKVKKIGIVLEGGGVRGAYQAGALKALYENKIKPDVITGTSIGALNG
ncbi:MAG TPA: patatin-like phospholipase family protein, partial [Clostridia bacterium]|nr:patatin-like phospholipase family protein [Clostridia bacterium]